MGDFVGDLDPRDQGGGDLTLPGAHALWAVHAGCSVKRELEHCFRSFGFEFQGRCSAFTSWRARERDPKTFSLATHNQELVLGHVTFVLQQLFQISPERSLC